MRFELKWLDWMCVLLAGGGLHKQQRSAGATDELDLILKVLHNFGIYKHLVGCWLPTESEAECLTRRYFGASVKEIHLRQSPTIALAPRLSGCMSSIECLLTSKAE